MKALMVRTDFSLGESALKAENAVKIAREAGYTAVISADSMNIASVIPLQRAAGDDMAVICGVKLNIVDDPTYEHRAKLAKESMRCMESLERGRNYSFTALIKNEKGYRDICELMTAFQHTRTVLLCTASLARTVGFYICQRQHHPAYFRHR